MEDGALWQACNTQPMQQVGIFNGPDNQTNLLSHADNPYLQFYASDPDQLFRSDEIPDISSLVGLPSFDPVLNLPAVTADVVHDFVGGNSKFRQHGQWSQNLASSEAFYPSQDMHEILSNQFIQTYNPSVLPSTNLVQDYSNLECSSVYNKSFGTITPYHNRSIPVTTAQMSQYVGSSSMAPTSMGMFSPSVTLGIISPGLGGGGNCNLSLMHLPTQHHAHSHAPKIGGDVTASEMGSVTTISTGAGATAFTSNQNSSSTGIFPPLATPSHMKKLDAVTEDPPKMASFNPGPFVSSARVVSTQKQQLEQQNALSPPRMWLENNNAGNSSTSSVPNLGFEQRQQQAMGNSSPIANLGFEQRQQQQAVNKPSPVPNLVFEQRQQQALSSPPSIPNLGVEQRRQQPMSNTSPISNLGFEQRQQPCKSTTPPISNMSYDQRQQPALSNPRSAKLDSGDSISKWPAVRMGGVSGGCIPVPGSEKGIVLVQQPDTGTMKRALPRNMSGSVKPSADMSASSVHKRPLWADDSKNQGGPMMKKPMPKFSMGEGCSRLETISAAAHHKVSQSTSGRALGPALNTNLKPRARQGSANDPQSIAARVRRERISERLKVLQALIPNGDKVDMVTMLEKAINYVQCLELQIRMLKNDSLWPKALGPLPNTLQELLELAGPEFIDGKNAEETPEQIKKSAPEVIEFDGNQPSADKE